MDKLENDLQLCSTESENSLMTIHKTKEENLAKKMEERKSDFLKLNIESKLRMTKDSLEKKLRKDKRNELIKKKRGIETIKEIDFKGGYGEEFKNITFTNDDIGELSLAIQNEDDHKVLYGLVGLRKLLATTQDSPIQQVIDTNVVPYLINLLTQFHKPLLQFEAAWCLTNIGTGTKFQVNCLLEKGIIQKFAVLLESPYDQIKDQAIWGLGNIAGDNTEFRDLTIEAGLINKFIHILQTTTKKFLIKNTTWALTNLCRGRPLPLYSKVEKAIYPICHLLVTQEDELIIQDCCWALYYLTDGGEDKIPQIVNFPKILPRLIQLITHKDLKISIASLRTVGNIISGDDIHTQMVIDNNVLNSLLQIIKHEKKVIRKEVYWVISNFTAGTVQQLEAVINSGILAHMIQTILAEDYEVQKEGIWAISNSTAVCTWTQLLYLIQMGIVNVLSELLIIPDSKILGVILQALNYILKKAKNNSNDELNGILGVVEESGGLKRLELLQMHQNEEIYKKALKILENYFDVEENIFQETNEANINIFKF